MTTIGVDLTVIRIAWIPTPYAYVFRAAGGRLSRLRRGLSLGDDALVSPCLAYAVRHPEAGLILIDTGLHPDASRHLRRDFGLPMSLLFRGIRPATRPFDTHLRELGIEPEQVGWVLMTHLHVDHTSGMRLLPNARFACSREEWAAAHARFGAAHGYVRHHLPAPERVQLVDFADEGEPFGPFPRSLDLLGDGSIRLLSTPGHTTGHLSILLTLHGGQRVLVVGDAAYTRGSIDDGLLPMITAGDEESLRSLSQLKAFGESDPEAILVPSHDPDAWHALRDVATISDGSGRGAAVISG